MSGKTDTYYVVQTKDSTFWLPVNNADNERTRPLVPPQTIKNKVIETLQDDPQEMASNYQTRRKRIKEVNASGKIVLVAQLVRDLTFRKAKKGSLATLDEKDLEYLKNRLITEWARSVGKTRENVAQKVENLLQLHRS